MASNESRLSLNFNNGFIFAESGITFSVYPDGEFDFYINNQVAVNAQINLGAIGISFNSGFDYGPYVQYDDFGAVVQIENIPIFYDYYGRVSKIGNVNIWYRNNRVYRIGGMQIFYNPSGFYSYHTGFINTFNQTYIFNPFHTYFARPAASFCLVSRNPYRRWYRPIRYRYYEPYRNNFRRSYAQIGRINKHLDRTDRNRIYQNNSRISSRNNTTTPRAGYSRGNTGIDRRSESITEFNSRIRSNKNTNNIRTNPGRQNYDGRISRYSSSQTNRNLGNSKSSSGVQKSNLSQRTYRTRSSPKTQNNGNIFRKPVSSYRSQSNVSRQGSSRSINRSASENRRSSGSTSIRSNRSGNN